MLWNYLPDWQAKILERLEWTTDVITNFDGSEQRIALRQVPRVSIEFAFLVDNGKQRRELEVKLWANGAKAWDIPIFTDTEFTLSKAYAGTKTLAVSTQHNRFAVGKKVFLYDYCDKRYHLNEITALTANSITLKNNLVESWDAETAVVPVETGFIDPKQQVTRFDGGTIYDNVRFELESDQVVTPEIPEATYRSHPVITTPSDWQQDLTLQYQRKMQLIEFNNSTYRDDETGQPTLIHSHYWTLDSREKIHHFKQFLYARRGRLTVCWLPSFLNDLQVVAINSSQINIDHCHYTTLYAMNKNRRDIRIELTDGTLFYRRIVACSEASSMVEQLTLDNPIPQNITPDDVERISFMSLSRLASDKIDLSWQWSDLVNVAANWMSTNDDL